MEGVRTLRVPSQEKCLGSIQRSTWPPDSESHTVAAPTTLPKGSRQATVPSWPWAPDTHKPLPPPKENKLGFLQCKWGKLSQP